MMYKILKISLIMILLFLSGCSQDKREVAKGSSVDNTFDTVNEPNVLTFANSLKIKYTVIDNIGAKDCKELVKSGLCFDAKLSLSLEESVYLPRWKIFFSNMAPILTEYSEFFDITHVNGDLHFISPSEKLDDWSGDQLFEIPFKSEFSHISEFDSPPNFYLVVEGFQPQLISSTVAKIDQQSGQEFMQHMNTFVDEKKQFKRNKKDNSVWDTAEKIYLSNRTNGSERIDATYRIIPKPLKQSIQKDAKFLDVSAGLKITSNNFDIDTGNPAINRLISLGVKVSETSGVPLIIEELDLDSLSKEDKALLTPTSLLDKTKEQALIRNAYLLNVSEANITIKALSEIGVFYGIQSIASLYRTDTQQLSITQVVDKPRYEYRGFFIDVARNYRDVNYILKILDQMAAYKLNKFHFHLGDDEGWRLEIPGLPELTELGAHRCHDPAETQCLSPQLGSGPFKSNRNNGFFSLQDYQTILKAASDRHIQVIPSFDMPGHSRAAVKSMQLRYKKFLQSGDRELAEEYLLSDQDDLSDYSSVQFYNDNTLNVCKESTYRFVEKVLNEVIAMHKTARHPLKTYHIGADETAGAWKKSPECKKFVDENELETEQLTAYFIQRVAKFLDSKGVTAGGWSDGLSLVKTEKMPKRVHVNVWTPLFWGGHKVAHSMANQDWKVVLSMPDVTYFDFPYQADPKERGYYWGTRNTNTRQIFEWMPDNLPIHAEIWRDRENNSFESDDRFAKTNEDMIKHEPKKVGKSFHGIQAQLWSEMVRSDEIADYLIFPRLLALAERAWHKPSWEIEYNSNGELFNSETEHFTSEHREKRDQDWLVFSNAVTQKEMAKLDMANIFYRLPTAGALVEKNKLFLNSAFPGLPLQYKLDNGNWLDFQNDSNGVSVGNFQNVRVRTTNPSGLRVGRYLSIRK